MITVHPVATAWLARVEQLAVVLPDPERAELLADLSDHLDRALHPNPSTDAVAAVLDRLGDPADIVAAATVGSRERPAPATPPPPATLEPPPGRVDDTLTGWEITVLVGLVVSGLFAPLFVLSVPLWVLSVVLLFTRTRWVGVERLVGLAVPVGFAVILSLGLFATFPSGAMICEGSAEVGEVPVETCYDDAGNVVDPDAASGVEPWGIAAIAVPPIASTAGLAWMVRRLSRRIRRPA
ncbi:HAAS signaling domain-containing protein [Salsipaludibacter albus]|uniref:HAAS signaling domain-containing protein n=1 Tax=Salsipaludibacter albus TaxID=2849650 RepID=UPI001EE41876|nr:hypothetical protein [Salsipaludibacter albus]MBY5162564.1 hypothetical protein [Salsipaludibacter albus]